MTRLLWLPGVLRAAGLTVHEQSGWTTRGSDSFDPYGLIVHATAGRLSVDSDIRVLLTGSATAPAPIAQLFLARSGEWWVIASGRCNHALTGRAGLLRNLGNSRLIGIEAANDNRSEPWPKAQYDSYVRGVAAICRHLGWDPLKRVSGHKEHQPPPDKFDPTFDMHAFRAHVKAALTSPVPLTGGDFDMIKVVTVQRSDQVHYYGWIAGRPLVSIQTNEQLEAWRALARAALQPTDLAIPADLYDAAFPDVAVPDIPGGEQLAGVVAAAIDSRVDLYLRKLLGE